MMRSKNVCDETCHEGSFEAKLANRENRSEQICKSRYQFALDVVQFLTWESFQILDCFTLISLKVYLFCGL